MSGVSKIDALIVDDDTDIIDTCMMHLEDMDIFRHIITAKDGVEASVKLMNQKFAVILLDMNLPKKKGIDIIRQFKTNPHNSIESVIIISGELNKQILETSLQLGVKHIVIKPFTGDMLKDKVKKVIDSKK